MRHYVDTTVIRETEIKHAPKIRSKLLINFVPLYPLTADKSLNFNK